MTTKRLRIFGVAGVAQRSIDDFMDVLEEAARDGKITADEYPALLAWGEKVRTDVARILDVARPESEDTDSTSPAALSSDADAGSRAGEEDRS